MTVLLSQASIPVAALDIVQERVERVARRANRKGFPVPWLVPGKREVGKVMSPPPGIHPEDFPYGIPVEMLVEHEVEYVDIEIYAPGPLQIEGWTFIASVDQIEVEEGRTETLYRRVPGTDDIPLPDWDKAPDDCDHCGLKRQRNETFLLHTAINSGARIGQPVYKQVGRQCVRDFIGYDPDAMLAAIDAYQALVFGADEISGWGASAPRVYSVDDVLDAAARVILIRGFYVSKQKARESEDASMFEDGPVSILVATGDEVRNFLSRTPWRPSGNWRDKNPWELHEGLPDAKITELIEQTQAGVDEMKAKDETSEWEDNVLLVMRAKHIEWKHVGIAASAILVGWRRVEREAKAKVSAGRPPSTHIGEPGGKIDLEAVIERIIFIENDWGGTFIVRMRAEQGDLIWWASSEPRKVKGDFSPESEYHTGDRVQVKGTVKRHEIDKITHQPVTNITRCKLFPIVEPVRAAAPAERDPDQLPF